MTVLRRIFPAGKAALMTGGVDFINDDIRIMLFMQGSTALTESPTIMGGFSNLLEFDGTGYTTGGSAITGQSVTVDTVLDLTNMAAVTLTFPLLAGGSDVLAGFVLYKFDGTLANSTPLLYEAGAPFPIAAGLNFTIQMDASGIWHISEDDGLTAGFRLPSYTSPSTETSFVANVRLDGPSASTVTMDVGVHADSTAVESTHFSYSPSLLSFAPGSVSEDVTITVISRDTADDLDIVLELSNANTVDIGTAQTTLTLEHLVVQGEKPGAHNTGPTNLGILTDASNQIVTVDGTVIENLNIDGRIEVRANNVTIRNCIVNSFGFFQYPIGAHYGFTGTLIEDCEVLGASSACIFGSGFTARRCNVHESTGDAFKARFDSVIEACWIHHIGTAPGAHADGNQTRIGDNLLIQGNNFDMPIDVEPPYKSNACSLAQTGLGPVNNVRIIGNWLNGGNYTIYFVEKPAPNGFGGHPTNCQLIDNLFGRDYNFGPLSNTTSDLVISGNRWEDDGTLMDINNA